MKFLQAAGTSAFVKKRLQATCFRKCRQDFALRFSSTSTSKQDPLRHTVRTS